MLAAKSHWPRSLYATHSRAAIRHLSRSFAQLFRSESFRAALFLILLLNVDFFPCIWGDRTLLQSAQNVSSILPSGAWASKRAEQAPYFFTTLDPASAAWVTEPALPVIRTQYLTQRTVPLWNPYQGFGQPFAADMQSQPFQPLFILLSLFTTPTTYDIFLLLRLFVTGFFSYLYLRLFVSFLPALATGVASLLAGYFLLFLAMPYLSVDMLTPLALYSAERLVRHRKFRTTVEFAIVSFLVFIGGMPESSLILSVFVYSYALFRIMSDGEIRRNWRPAARSLLIATVTGLCLSAFLLVPFYEYVRNSFNGHEARYLGGQKTGLLHDALDQSVFTYLFPLIFGPPFAPTLEPQYPPAGIRNEIGLVALFLALVAFLCVRRRQTASDQLLATLTWFFGAFVAFTVLKRYGSPLVNWVGSLPLFSMVIFPKYFESVLSISAAMLCGLGLERIAKRDASPKRIALALVTAFGAIPVTGFVARDVLDREVSVLHVPFAFPIVALGLPAFLLFVISVGLVFHLQSVGRTNRWFTLVVFACLGSELSLNYIPEMNYFFNGLAYKEKSPYLGSPYINWLHSRQASFDRVFGRDSILYPNWASVYQLFDIRSLDAMYYRKYLSFVRNFLTPSASDSDDLYDRFTGASFTYTYAFNTARERRLLQLSSVRYLLTNQPYQNATFRKVYDHEVRIYRFDDILSRAALYFRAEVLNNEAEIARKLADPQFNIFQTVLLDATKLKPDDRAKVNAINKGQLLSVQAATITSYGPMAVQVSASLPQKGMLVLNDSDYPGWTVNVDGRQSRWTTANYLFRGVLLEPGFHKVRFEYRPRSFLVGALLSALACCCLIVAGVCRVINSRHAHA